MNATTTSSHLSLPSGSLRHGHTLLSQLPLVMMLDPGFRRGDGQALPHISIDGSRQLDDGNCYTMTHAP